MIFGVECVDSSLQRVYHGTPTWRQSRLLWVAMHFGHVGENTLYKGGGRKIKESAELRTAEVGGCVCLAEAEKAEYLVFRGLSN